MTIDYTKPPQMVPPQPAQPQKTSGCWKWGAIGCAIVLVVIFAGIAGLVFFVFRVIRTTDVYTQALHRAQTSPAVISVLGEPIAAGWWVSGSVHVKNRNGEASITFPIFGPKGKARVHAEARGRDDIWTYSELTVKPERGPEIDLVGR
ncbi:MAG TPA: cytochrome c oxidase assembly factor Coa1 family protein [Thermoanaerobaculia bacterium]